MAGRNCLVANDWVCWEYVRSRSEELTDATVEHVWITALSVLIGIAVAVPSRCWPAAAGAGRRPCWA